MHETDRELITHRIGSESDAKAITNRAVDCFAVSAQHSGPSIVSYIFDRARIRTLQIIAFAFEQCARSAIERKQLFFAVLVLTANSNGTTERLCAHSEHSLRVC